MQVQTCLERHAEENKLPRWFVNGSQSRLRYFCLSRSRHRPSRLPGTAPDYHESTIRREAAGVLEGRNLHEDIHLVLRPSTAGSHHMTISREPHMKVSALPRPVPLFPDASAFLGAGISDFNPLHPTRFLHSTLAHRPRLDGHAIHLVGFGHSKDRRLPYHSE